MPYFSQAAFIFSTIDLVLIYWLGPPRRRGQLIFFSLDTIVKLSYVINRQSTIFLIFPIVYRIFLIYLCMLAFKISITVIYNIVLYQNIRGDSAPGRRFWRQDPLQCTCKCHGSFGRTPHKQVGSKWQE